MGRYDALLQVEENPITHSPAEQSKPVVDNSLERKAQTIPLPAQSSAETGESTPAGAVVRRGESAPARTGVRVRRTITRYAFEFFQDQVEILKRFSIDEQIRGEKGSMSLMVREAVDAYIAKRKRTEE